MKLAITLDSCQITYDQITGKLDIRNKNEIKIDLI